MRQSIINRSTHRLGKHPSGAGGKLWAGPRASAPLEALEGRLFFSGTKTAFAGGDLTISVSASDHVTITEAVAKGGNDVSGPYNFTVTGSHGAVGGKGPGAFSNVKNITVNVAASGSIISVQGIADNAQDQATGISGNLTITDTKPNNALSVEVHDGFTVGGAVSISNTGKGSAFVPHTIDEGGGALQVETGVFLDPNRKGSYGSVKIDGSGPVGVDGIKVLGDLTVDLGSAASSFVAGAEWVYRQDPHSPPWTTFRQDNSTVGGNLTVNGGHDTEVYSSIVAGSVRINEVSSPQSHDYALLGGVSVGNGLAINALAGTSGVFADFSSIVGPTFINEGNGKNVIGVDSTFFGGSTHFSQGQAQTGNFIFIDSEADLLSAAGTVPGGLPDDSAYILTLQAFGQLPFEAGSTFAGIVTSTQGQGAHQLDIAQDTSPITVFAAMGSVFKAGAGKTLGAASGAHGLPITIIGYNPLTITGF